MNYTQNERIEQVSNETLVIGSGKIFIKTPLQK